MYEQDVKLARMLIEKITAIRSEEDSVKSALSNAQAELERIQQIREERDAYLAILSEAADLLDSKDLVIENPDTTEQQEQVDNLEYKIEELDEESQKYNRLMEALREKAPQLFESFDGASGTGSSEQPEADEELESEETSASLEEVIEEAEPAAVISDGEAESAEYDDDNDDAEDETQEEDAADSLEEGAAELETAAAGTITHEAEPETPEEVADGSDDELDVEADLSEDSATEAPTLEIHVSSNGHAGEVESVNSGNGSHEAVAEDAGGGDAAIELSTQPVAAEEVQVSAVKVAVESPERTLSRFNLDHLKKKEAFTFGRGAAYIVDGDSVLDRLPYYDFSLRGVLEIQTRDELARDIDVLSTELHGKFHIVYNSRYKPSISLGEDVTLDCANGDGGKDAADEHIRNLVSELIAKHTCVCVITGDVALADSVRGQSIHILQLHDFFRA